MTTTPTTPPTSDDLADRAAPLDALLVDAALGTRRFIPTHRRRNSPSAFSVIPLRPGAGWVG